jgi:hypothetical protein
MEGHMTAAVVEDNTATYLQSRAIQPDRNLNYARLDEIIRARSGIDHFDLRILFSTFDERNEGQSKFLAFRKSLGWEIVTVDPREAAVRAPSNVSQLDLSSLVRFDAQIAYCLGRLAGKFDHVVVLSDSYSLYAPMLETVERQTEVTLCFFGQCLDGRWSKHLHKVKPQINWIDLDREQGDLFGAEQTRTFAGGLRRLP